MGWARITGMKILLGLGLILAVLCARAKAGTPDWFSDFEKTVDGCNLNYLCLAGEGESLKDALGMARTEVAKYFQTKVQSSSQVSVNYQQKGIMSASIEEWSNKTLKEETDELLSGLEVKKQEEKDGRYFVVVGLSKSTMAKELKSRIEALDLENSKAFELNSRFAYPKILKNLAVIDKLIDRYRLVSVSPLVLQVKREDVLEKIAKLKPIKIGMMTKGKKLSSPLSRSLNSLFSPLRLVFVPVKSGPKYLLLNELAVEEQYLKVEGFKKLNVNLKIELRNRASQAPLGRVSAFSEQVARTPEQAIEKAAPELQDYLQEHLEELTTLKLED